MTEPQNPTDPRFGMYLEAQRATCETVSLEEDVGTTKEANCANLRWTCLADIPV